MANYDLTYEGSEVQGILDTGEKLKADGYILMGGASPSTLPGTPTKRVAYIGGPGTYSNFGSTVVVPSGSIGVFKYDDSQWVCTVISPSVPVSTTVQDNDTTVPTGKAVKTAVDGAVGDENTAREEADAALQGLIDEITDNIENGYVYAGIATPSTTPVTGKVFYIALQGGMYTHFDNTAVMQGINFLKYNGSSWLHDAYISISDKPIPSDTGLVKAGGTFDFVMDNGSAFDLSKFFASGSTLATYENLSAALTDLDGLDAAYKRGGMSIRYVQSSDNKYVQYRLMAQNFTTDVTQWQGVDDEPTAGSENLVKSGGTFIIPKALQQANSAIINSIGSKLSIIGDSISTYNGTMPDGYPTYYPADDVVDLCQMWWKMLLNSVEAALEVNASYDGGLVTNYEQDRPDFYARTSILGNPDTIFVALGTHDSTRSVNLGDYDFNSSIENLSEATFRTAYIKGIKALKQNYPSASIYLFIFKMGDNYVNSIKEIAAHYGLPYIEVRDYVGLGNHPYYDGMKLIARRTIMPMFNQKNVASLPALDNEKLISSSGVFKETRFLNSTDKTISKKLGLGEFININTLPQHNGSPATEGNTWYYPNGRHVVIPCVASDVFNIVNYSDFKAQYYWLTDDSDATVNYVSGTGRVEINNLKSVNITAPSGANYLGITTKGGNNTQPNLSVEKLTSDKLNIIDILKAKEKPLSSSNQLIADNDAKTFTLSGFEVDKGNGSISTVLVGSIPYGYVNGESGTLALVYNLVSETFAVKNYFSNKISDSDVILMIFRITFGTQIQSSKYEYTINYVIYCPLPFKVTNNEGSIDESYTKFGYSEIQRLDNQVHLDNFGIIDFSNNFCFEKVYDALPLGDNRVFDDGKSGAILIPRGATELTITANNNYSAQVTFYKTTDIATGCSTIDGSRHMITKETTETLTIPSDAKYVFIAVVNTVLANSTPNSAIFSFDVINKIKYYNTLDITMQSELSYERLICSDLVAWRDGNASQGGAIYNNYYFQLRHSGVADYFTIGEDNTLTYIGTFDLGSKGATNHAGTAQFANKVTEGDFPYLYVSAGNDYKCYVEKLSISDNVITSQLIQTINLNSDIVSDILAFDANAATGCYAVDDKYIYLSVGPMYTPKIKIYKFNKPETTSDVTLTMQDLVDSFVIDGLDRFIRQDMKAYGNFLYMCHGGTYSVTEKARGVLVMNTNTGEVVMNLDLQDFTHEELEALEIYKGNIYIFTLGTNYYVFNK